MPETEAPVRSLRDRLETERLTAIEALARQPAEAMPADLLHRLAELHLALTAVRDEIDRHEVKLGHGSEEPLR